ncbi:hypothetical protein LTR56_011110 [Elasticomyces elasticus]|nr:hypothetical protein LTR56_011110 [Elasticomyces elasticus]KAK3662469.1 hypothetical protein LTR22_006748 [Elasticomyces elasticus]KAK4926458.1 hypothetical protein LTR49_006665 [Elasticomyces elasticus]KAK5761168.1 hypothetical protein LTS12_008649 [Elasticomyces elasticus]
MRPSDDLIKSGLLYERNFDAWREQMVCTLQENGVKVDKDQGASVFVKRLIFNRLNPALLARLRERSYMGHYSPGSLEDCFTDLKNELEGWNAQEWSGDEDEPPHKTMRQLTHSSPKSTVSDQLTKSGLLYEGNFVAWHQQMVATLRVFETEAHAPKSRYSDTNDSRKMTLILHRISPELQKRPFRLNDLPAELRDRVYNSAFFATTICDVHSCASPRQQPTRVTLPILLKLSRSITTEALPFFHASVNYRFDFQAEYLLRFPAGGDSAAVRMIRRWARDKLRDNVKYLRQLSVGVVQYDGYFTIRFEPKKGLTVSCPPGCPSEVVSAWEKHIKESEAKRQDLGSVGEAVVLAVVSKPELWH